ncbi:MAG: lysophospholipid acyltransferase family protein [Bacteroidales bacterium]|nr:lysophospholipid acyltransferase family protein [Bacteroidales bacterium]
MKQLSVFLLRAVLRLLAALPLKVHYFNARWLAWLVGGVLGYRRDVVTINLSRAFPEKKYAEIVAIKKAFYLHFSELIVETLWFGGCTEKRLRRAKLAEAVGMEEVGRLYAQAPGVVIMTGHTGNWELIGGIESFIPQGVTSCIRRDNFVVTYKRFSSAVWDDIIRYNRAAPLQCGGKYEGYVESASTLRYVIEHRNEKKVYFFNTDQSPYNGQGAGLEIEFLHQRTHTMTAAARLAQKYGFAVTYLEMARIRQGRYELRFKTLCDDASQMSVEAIMQRYYGMLEESIQNAPANYLWSHRRWKIRV